ncbi:MAG: ABC transporter permease, partial [Propionibacteriaceae bacterium]|nr:ABC transporter permease [Propionibacteriaceae bacterium]
MTDRVTDPAAPTVAGWPAPAVTGRTTRRATPGAWSVALGRWQVMRRQLPLIVATALGTPIFYLLGLGHGLGQSVGVIGQGAGGPVPYVDYIAPALLVAACTAVAITEWTWPIVDGYVWQKNFHPIAHTPLAPRQIAHGLILAGGGRMAFVAVVYTAVMAATGHVRNWWAVPLLPVIGVAGGLAFGLLVLAFATALKRENGLLNNVIRLIYLPMTLFSATFYPLAALPAWLHWIGWISPLWHAAETGR